MVHIFFLLAQDGSLSAHLYSYALAASPHEKVARILITKSMGCVPVNNAMETLYNAIKCGSMHTKCNFSNEKKDV